MTLDANTVSAGANSGGIEAVMEISGFNKARWMRGVADIFYSTPVQAVLSGAIGLYVTNATAHDCIRIQRSNAFTGKATLEGFRG